MNKKRFTLILTAVLTFLLDQYSKSQIRANLQLRENFSPIAALPFLRIVHWKNTGVAFGLFQGSKWVYAFVAVGILALLILSVRRINELTPAAALALGLQLGGALGNLVDRLTIGYVVDFIWVGDFPVFNLADAAICIGAFILLLTLGRESKSEENEKDTLNE